MVRGLLLALSLAALLGGSAVAGERPLLAVLDFDGSQAKLSDAEVVELTEIARKEAFDRLGSRYDIITRENLVDLLKSHGKTLERCQGECETETGRLIGADVVVSGAVRKVFGGYSLSLKAHSTDPPKVLGIEKGKTKDREEIPDLVVGAATKLYSGLRESVPPTTVPTGRGAQGSKEATKGDDDWPLEAADTSFVTFVSDPPGAEV